MDLSANQPTRALEALLPADLYAAINAPEADARLVREAYLQLNAMLVALEPLVPAMIHKARRTATGPEVLPAQYMGGTLLYADLSGFTALATQLARVGRQGSEEVSAIINQIFSRLLRAVDAAGGEVVKFAGDAIMAFFAASELGPNHPMLAVDAALNMQQAMRDFDVVPTSSGTFRLRLRVTVHSGMVLFGEVGDEHHRELLFTGRAVNQVIMAQRHTAAGEIVITPQTRSLLSGIDTRERFPDLYLLLAAHDRPSIAFKSMHPWTPALDHAELLRMAASIQALRTYVPPGFLQRMTGIISSEGEFRPVSIIFTHIAAFTNALALLDSGEGDQRAVATVHQILNTCYVRLQAVLAYFGGSINKVDMAVGGDRLMGTFGAPIAHEDDPVRAVKAALELRTALHDIDRDTTTLLRSWREIQDVPTANPAPASAPSIGLASGIVFAGIVGTPQRREYTVMGEIVNLAARLFEAAIPGDLVLPAATYQSVRDVVEAEPLAPLRLKGFASPINVFKAHHLRASSGHMSETPFVGRLNDLSRIRERLGQALTRGEKAGCIIALVGDAGMGKTRLAEEALRHLDSPAIIRVICQSYEQTVPYAAIGRIMRELLHLNPALPRLSQLGAVQQQVNQLVSTWSRFLPLLAPILGLPIEETGLTRGLSPAQRRERTDELLVLLIQAAARHQPTVLLVDTMEQIDASSAAILQQVAAGLPGIPLALLLTYRPVANLNLPWGTPDTWVTLGVPPLSYPESATLLGNLLGGSLPNALHPLVERAAGTPVFLEQTAHYLLSTNAVARTEAGGLTIANPEAIQNIPGQIEQLIVARLDQLGEDTRSVVQLAAVIGHEFAGQTLAAVVPSHTDHGGRLRDLVDAGILEVDAHAVHPMYRFRQALIRDVAYDSLLYARRQFLHAATAQAMEQLYAGDLDELRVILAHHYQRGAQPEPAFFNTMVAAEQAQKRYANQEALVLYEQALALAQQLDHLSLLSPEATLRVYGQAGDVLAAIGVFDGARSHYNHVLAMEEHLTFSQRATVQRKIGSTHEQQGDWDNALKWFVAAADNIAASAPDHAVMLEYALILSDIGWVYFRQGDLEAAQRNLDQARDLIEPLDVANEEATILNRLGGLAYMSGDMEQSQAYVAQSLAASERGGNLIAQAAALVNLGNLAAGQGLAEESIRFYEQAMVLHEQTGSQRLVAITANNLCLSLRDVGRYEEALQLVEQAYAIAVEQRDKYVQMITLGSTGRILTLLNNDEIARQRLLESLAIAYELDMVSEQINSYVLLGELALQQDDLATALAEMNQGLAIVTDTDSEEYGYLQRLEAQVSWRQGNHPAALRLLQQNYELFRELQNIPEARRTKKLLGSLSDEVEAASGKSSPSR